MPAPLKGIKVIELGTMITAPLAAMLLADFGAEVIKVERPGTGDPFRSHEGGLYSPHFVAFNRNKKSVTLDLQSPEGRNALLKLLDQADVLIDNFRPGVLTRLDLDSQSLRTRNSRLIHCSITGFGSHGPYSNRPAYDSVGQAMSGISSLAIDPDAPSFMGTTISDNVAGMYAAYAVLGALFERQPRGEGRRVEVNMLETSVAFMPDAFMNFEMLGLRNTPFTRVSFSQAYAVTCRDHKLLMLHLSSLPKFWRGLLQVLSRPDLDSDPRFARREARVANYRELAALLDAEFGARDRSEWMALLNDHDVPFAPVQTTDEALEDPQLQALQSFRLLTLADGRSVRAIQSPVLMDGQRLDAWNSPPALGAHTEIAFTDAAPRARTSD